MSVTQGPWRVIRGTSVVTPSIAPVGKGPQVAMTMFPGEYDCDANARLIAAAPELRDALSDLLEKAEMANGVHIGSIDGDCLANAKRALEQAGTE